MNQKSYFAEEARKAYEFWGNACKICGKPATQLAHCIPQRKEFLARYGYRIIHSRYNRLPACSLDCNAKIQCNAASDMVVEDFAKKAMRLIAHEDVEGEAL